MERESWSRPLHSDLCILESPVLCDMKFLLELRKAIWEDLVLFMMPSVAPMPATEVM